MEREGQKGKQKEEKVERSSLHENQEVKLSRCTHHAFFFT